MIIIKIRDLRQSKDLTQEKLANILGISRQSVIALENGRYMPSLPLACEIAKFFQVGLDQLFSMVDEEATKLNNNSLLANNNQEVNMKTRMLSPWSPLRDISDEVDDLLDNTWPNLSRLSFPEMPAVNLRQDEKNVYVEMNVPGFKEDELDIDVADDYVVISGQKKEEDQEKRKGYFRREFSQKSFSRTVGIPVLVDTEKVQAEVEKGILQITLPKAEPEKPKTKKIAVKKK